MAEPKRRDEVLDIMQKVEERLIRMESRMVQLMLHAHPGEQGGNGERRHRSYKLDTRARRDKRHGPLRPIRGVAWRLAPR